MLSSSRTASLRRREREKKRRSLFSPPSRGRIIVAWKFINRDNKQDPSVVLVPSPGWNIGYYAAIFLASKRKKKNGGEQKLVAKRISRRSWSNFVDETRPLTRGIRFVRAGKGGREKENFFSRNYFQLRARISWSIFHEFGFLNHAMDGWV